MLELLSLLNLTVLSDRFFIMNLQSSLDWTVTQTKGVFQSLLDVVNDSLFTFAGENFSLGLLIALIAQAVLVLLVANAVKQLLKKRILPKFGLAIGTQESLAAITSYLVIAIGLLVVLESAGINLGSLAVFAGALGLGFGIGLQNVASNFISGLTLLFEQPIKIGDYVEVDQLAGTVEQISIRSTTIRTVNGIFVIVPNSRFLDNSVVNWSYRDPKCRIVVPVQVADESDSLTVMEALLAAARQESRVLPCPSPEVYFKGMQEDALKFELLVWIEQPIESESIKSSLQFLIEAEFHERAVDPRITPTIAIANLSMLLQSSLVEASYIPGMTSRPSNGAVSDGSVQPINGWMLRDLLRKVSYFQQCNDVELRQVIEKGYRKKLVKDEIICRENDPGDSFYIILLGAVDVFVESIEEHIAVRRAGEFIGEMSLLMGTPRTATLRTLEETILFVVDRGNLQSLLTQHQGLADKIAQELSQRQEALKSVGIEVNVMTKGETPFEQIRKRIRSIFGA
jgi:potassium-dependent mechanosensitive channel